MNDKTCEQLLAEVQNLEMNTSGEDFLLSWDKSVDDIRGILAIAEILKELHRQGKSFRAFDTGLAVSIFRDKSTRTRFSFASAASALGLTVADLDEEKSQISHGETVRETANMISFLTEVIGIRDDMFLDQGNAYMREVAGAVTEGHKKGILHRRPTLVNLQCDKDHPTQSLSDLLMLKSYFGSLKELRGKKIAMTWAYSPSYGKPLSVPQGIISLMTRFGMDVVLAHPPGYDLIPEIESMAAKHASGSAGSFTKVDTMEGAFEGAHVVYPKSWAPYRVMKQRTELLQHGDKKGLSDLEKECLRQNAAHISWECDDAKMKTTDKGNALYMHCLPADISQVSCDRGEVTESVFERYRLKTYAQASFKPFIIAAMILASKMADPAFVLDRIISQERPSFLYGSTHP